MTRMAILLLSLGLSALACAGTPTSEQQPTRNKARSHVMVQFTDMSLHPSIAQVVEGGTVSWVNYASTYEGSVVFSDEVASTAFACDLRPNWMKTGTGYQSVPITMGGASNDLETPCALRSGEYEYEIWLFQGRGTIDNPDSRISGKIVVK
jgi:hypothetical protein